MLMIYMKILNISNRLFQTDFEENTFEIIFIISFVHILGILRSILKIFGITEEIIKFSV